MLCSSEMCYVYDSGGNDMYLEAGNEWGKRKLMKCGQIGCLSFAKLQYFRCSIL